MMYNNLLVYTKVGRFICIHELYYLIKMENRTEIRLTEHLFFYEDDPLKILYRDDGKINWLKYIRTSVADALLTEDEREMLKKHRTLLANVDDLYIRRKKFADKTVRKGLSEIFPDYAMYFISEKNETESLASMSRTKEEALERKKASVDTYVPNFSSPMTISDAMRQIMSMSDALKLYELFEETKKKLLKPSDFQVITKNGKVIGRFIKKSGWKKEQTFFGVSSDVTDVQVLTDEDGDPFALVKVRATWAGRSVTEPGTYSKKEMLAQRRPYNLSHMIATATTRANNRSVAAIIGGGEVSAEEIEESE